MNCGSEPVAAAELGPDKITVVAKSLPQRGDLNLQIRFRHHDTRPDTTKDFVFGDQ